MNIIKWIKSLFKQYNIYEYNGKYAVKEGWDCYLSSRAPFELFIEDKNIQSYCLVKNYADALILIQKRKDYLNSLATKKMRLV